MKIRRVCSYTTAKAHSAARNRRDKPRGMTMSITAARKEDFELLNAPLGGEPVLVRSIPLPGT